MSKNKWISVKKELPKSGEKVLTFNDFGTIEFDIYRAIGGWQLCECITHWMPLPEAPPQPKVKKVKEPKLSNVKEPKEPKKPKEPKPPQYKRLMEEHRCIRCKEPLPEGYTKTRCPECIKKDNAYLKEYYKGKCRMCCRELPPDYNYVLCKSCRIKRSQKLYERKQEQKNEQNTKVEQ
jgi:hypothetical protein